MIEQLRQGAGTQVVNPTNDLTPHVDPQIVQLLNQVSAQNLVSYVYTLEGFGTRNTFSDTESDDFGIGAARRWIFDEFQRVGGGRLEVSYQDYNFNFLGLFTSQRNVIATLPGRGNHPGVLVMMANYDTRAGDWLDGESLAPGADDNASGVAALLEAARIMSAYPWQQTIIFAAFTAEEQGTYGSRHFIEEAFLDNMSIDAGINNDMIGGRAGIPPAARVYSEGPSNSSSRHLARYVDFVGGLYLPTFPVWMMDGLDREGRWGDQREFVNAGYPAVRLIESEEDDEIQNSRRDTWNLIDYDYLRRMTQLNMAILANAAGGPARPAVPVVISEGPGVLRMGWPAQPGTDGYAVSIRPVESDRFGPFRFVSSLESDNILFDDLDPNTRYAVSIAPLADDGRIGLFSSPEVLVDSTP